jgi:hypothetical protein
VVTYLAVVGNMAVSHNQAVITYGCFPAVSCTPVDGNKFTDGGITADLSRCFFTCKFQILWNGAQYSSGKNATVFADPRTIHDGNITADPGTLTDHYITMDHRKRIDFYIRSDPSIGINIGKWMRHYLIFAAGG